MADVRKKWGLLRGLLRGSLARTGPFHVMVDVTRRCNLRCPGCRFHSDRLRIPAPGDPTVVDLSPSLFDGLCADLRALGTKTLFLLGEGEPLLHPGIFERIATAKSYGLEVSMISNGTLLDRKAVRSILDSRLDGLQVTLWADSAEGYRRQYPGADPANFDRVTEGLRLLSRARGNGKRPRLVLHQPINRLNHLRLGEMAGLARQVGCDHISFSPYLSYGRADALALTPEEERAVRLSLDRLAGELRGAPLQHNIGRVLLRYGLGKRAWELPCYIGWTHSRVRVDGTVVPCGACQVPLGDLNERRFPEIWNGPEYRALRTTLLSPEAPRYLEEKCFCEHCCYIEDNHRVGRIFRWLRPFRRRAEGVAS